MGFLHKLVDLVESLQKPSNEATPQKPMHPPRQFRGNPGGGFMEGAAIPYGVTLRPVPVGTNVDALLPKSVGSFVRESLQNADNVLEGPVYANYRSGASQVFVELGICADEHSALSVIDTAKSETVGQTVAPPHLYAKEGNTACLRTVSPDGAFFAWIRGSYYFSAHAKGGEHDLASFVASFPY